MSMQPVKTTANSGVPVFQTVIETAQGGFALVITDLASGATIKAGTPVYYDEATRLATPIIQVTAYALAASNATTYQVVKGSAAKVGGYLASAVGGKAYAITGIDTTSSDLYDTITVGTTIGAVAAGDGLFISSATGATAGALPVTPKGLIYEDTLVETGATVSVLIRGTVYQRRIPAMAATVKSAVPVHIIFSNSY